MTPTSSRPRAEIVVDLDAIRHNVRLLGELVAPAALMMVVKADGYGHGMTAVGRAAREAGVSWLGVATPDEAVALREAGDRGPLMCWLAAPGQDYREVIRRGVTVSASDRDALDAIAEAGSGAEGPVEVHLKVDTGLSRGGAPRAAWGPLFERARALQDQDRIRFGGVLSHLACADEPGHPANAAQEQVFADAVDALRGVGLEPGIRHLANSAGALLRPSVRFDLARVGIAGYGLNPAPGVLDTAALGLRPAMTVRATLALVKDIAAGDGVSYGHTFVADRPMRVGLVPAGYGDGVPRHASSTAEVQIGGRRCPVLGRICMDQFVVDVSAVPGVAPGDEVVLFGPGDAGEPTAQEWAEACGTISYELVTRIGGRMARTYRNESAS